MSYCTYQDETNTSLSQLYTGYTYNHNSLLILTCIIFLTVDSSYPPENNNMIGVVMVTYCNKTIMRLISHHVF